MRKINLNIDIEISNIEVDERYYSFEYEYSINGVCIKKESYDGDYCNDFNTKEWKEYLASGYAMVIILNRMFEDVNEDDLKDFIKQ